jgi:hypothetical protein
MILVWSAKNKLDPRIAICYRAALGKYEFQAGRASNRPDWLLTVKCKGEERDCEVSAELLVEFANCSDEIAAVQRFIQKYGPPFIVEGKETDCVYADTLGRWRMIRLQFCMVWDRMVGIEVRNEFTDKYGRDFPQLWKKQQPWTAVEARGAFRLSNTGPIFVAETLYMGMVAKLLMVAHAGKLRRCLNPNCTRTRYFIADHGKTQYCGEDCGKWGQRKAKLRYWHERKSGPAESPTRHQQPTDGRKPKSGSLKYGTQKAR